MNSDLEDESGETQETGEAGAREGDRLAGTGGLDGLAGGGLGRGDGADAGRGRGLGRDGGDGAVVVVRRAGAGAVNTLLVITALFNDLNTKGGVPGGADDRGDGGDGLVDGAGVAVGDGQGGGLGDGVGDVAVGDLGRRGAEGGDGRDGLGDVAHDLAAVGRNTGGEGEDGRELHFD